MRGTEDGKGIMIKGNGIMKVMTGMSKIEIGLLMREGIVIEEDKMIMIIDSERESLIITQKGESRGDEMREEEMMEGVMLIPKPGNLRREAEKSNETKGRRKTADKIIAEEDLVSHKMKGMEVHPHVTLNPIFSADFTWYTSF